MLTRFCQNNATLVVDEHNVQSNGETIKVSPDHFVTQDKRVDCVLKYDSEVYHCASQLKTKYV